MGAGQTIGDRNGYAVFLFDHALETLGEPIKPYLCDGPVGTHLACREIDTAGGFVEMMLDGCDESGARQEVELIVPTNMIRMIVSARTEGSFGFVPRRAVPLEPALPPTGPTAAPADAQPQAVPDSGRGETPPVQTPDKP
ncbi:hypothetical protein ACFFGH_06210 [Lysobacter korlensis]|uniref:Uncharacterized protein n=1 Tax=Lysobacter korlensis TaxID=553636 RepID=A0ABV6RKW6_9GAMM